jgi:hypothetical protein
MGRFVCASGDDRDELVEKALQTPNPSDRNAVRHAIVLYRSRGADREIKRSAVLALHRVLEDRRTLIQTEVMSKGPGALFQIANQFDLRHSGERQRTDYHDAYLDWIFWWYLATLELTDRIVCQSGRTPVSRLRAVATAHGDQGQDRVALLGGVPLTPDEAEYVEAARAANTLRGYR